MRFTVMEATYGNKTDLDAVNYPPQYSALISSGTVNKSFGGV